ncbi:MAG: hypothetical protein F4Z31_16245 [Gemmatimonadetes bacterium]|nr:hypothetical protein [Gemmatimonadota bacterium]MYE94506.1 hypothetical protein [Gemmatimonadota bacterium]MYJ10149.1 hypothetical protein [Gemmatimonadota bacterium]
MYELVQRSTRCALIVALALGGLVGVAGARESEAPAQDISNVLLTFHLIEADGFADEDPEISDVVTELRKLFNFGGYRLLSTSVFNVGLMVESSGRSTTGNGSQRIIPSDSTTPLTISAVVSSRRSTGSVRARVTLTDETTRPTEGILFASEERPLLEASVTMRDGQRVVLGSLRRTVEEPVLILVVTPRMVP